MVFTFILPFIIHLNVAFKRVNDLRAYNIILPCKLTLYEQLYIHITLLVIGKMALDLSREAIKWQKATIRLEVILTGKHDDFGLHKNIYMWYYCT